MTIIGTVNGQPITEEVAKLLLLKLEVDAAINDALKKITFTELMTRPSTPQNRAERRSIARHDRRRRRAKSRRKR